MEQLSGLDAMFVHAEMHGLPMHISSFSIYDPSTAPNGVVPFRDILALFEGKIQHEVPILRSRLVEVPLHVDQPYWVEDPHFDMVYHVRHIALPKPADWNKLFTLVANLHARPLNRARPLWEAYVIDGLDHLEGIPKGCFGLFLKVHHSIMDGRTGLAIYSNLHTLSPEPPDTSKPTTPAARDEEAALSGAPSLTGLLGRAVWNNTRKTLGLAKTVTRAAKVLTKLQLGMRAGDLHTLEKPKTRFNAPVSPGRVVDRQRLPIEDIKAIREAFIDATVNDVALTIIGGALRRYLAAKDELPATPLVAGVPVDVRTPDDAHVRGNMVSFMNVSLCTEMDDPLERLQCLHREAHASKNYHDAMGRTFVHETLDSLYAGLTSWSIRSAVESGLISLIAPVHNTVVTNVPGAPMPLYLAGAKMIDSFGMGPLLPNMGLFHTVTSTYETLNIAFTACRDMMGDPEFYTQCLGESFEELRDAALGGGARAAEQTATRSKARRRSRPRTRRDHAPRAAKKSPVRKASRQAGKRRKAPAASASRSTSRKTPTRRKAGTGTASSENRSASTSLESASLRVVSSRGGDESA